jgi:LysM repeat protein
MRLLFGNSCAKSCLVYIVVLAGVLAIGAMGLDGLRARFGMSRPQLSTMSAGGSVADVQITMPNPAEVLGRGGGGGGLNGPVGDGSDGGTGVPTFTPVPIPPPVLVPQPTTPPAPGQGGTITGEVSQPFYIVQPGDTLWMIAQRTGVSLDALRAANGITGDLIFPGQVLVLPAPGAAPPATPPGPPSTGASGPPPAPAPAPLPGTGEQQPNTEPVVPNMPDTGILKQRR